MLLVPWTRGVCNGRLAARVGWKKYFCGISLLSETELPALGDGEGNKDIEDGNFNCQVTCIFETA